MIEPEAQFVFVPVEVIFVRRPGDHVQRRRHREQRQNFHQKEVERKQVRQVGKGADEEQT
jgi:hypothetical protein